MPRKRTAPTRMIEKMMSRPPLRNWTHVVEAMPAVATMVMTIAPTAMTPQACGMPRSGSTSTPAPTICGMR